MFYAINILSAIILIVSMTGCGTTGALLIPHKQQLLSTSHFTEKNYVLNKENTAPVGSPIVKSYDYELNKYTLPELICNSDCDIISTVNFSAHGVHLTKGQVIKINWQSIYNGNDVYILDVATFNTSVEKHFLVADARGKIIPGLIYNSFVGSFIEWRYWKKVSNADTVFRFKETTSSSRKGVVNFELIYTGIQNENITVLYREYTADDMARPAYHQNLFFPTKDKVVRFNKIKIEVISATSEFLKYVVRED